MLMTNKPGYLKSMKESLQNINSFLVSIEESVCDGEYKLDTIEKQELLNMLHLSMSIERRIGAIVDYSCKN